MSKKTTIKSKATKATTSSKAEPAIQIKRDAKAGSESSPRTAARNTARTTTKGSDRRQGGSRQRRYAASGAKKMATPVVARRWVF